MGTVFKKTFTKPLPSGAEVFTRKGQQMARWKDKKGKNRTAALTTGADGQPRLLFESGKYVAKYRDAAGHEQVVPTGCRDETAARQVLARLEREAELIRSGVMTQGEAEIGQHNAKPLDGGDWNAARATGTDGRSLPAEQTESSSLAPQLALTPYNQGQSLSIMGNPNTS